MRRTTHARSVRPGKGVCRLLLIASLVGSGVALAQEPVRIAFGDRLVHAVLAIGVERGYFEREDLAVSLLPLERDDDLIEMIADDEFDLVVTTADQLIAAAGTGIELRGAMLLAIVAEGEAIVARDDVRDIPALRSRKIAIASGSSGELLLAFVLQRVGLSLADVELVALEPDAAGAALLAGDVDAIVLASPALERFAAAVAVGNAGTRPGSRILATATEAEGLVTELLAGTERWLGRNKETTKGVIRVWARSVGWVRRNPRAAAAIIAERLDISSTSAASALAGLRLLDVQDNVELLRGTYQKAFTEMSRVLERRTEARTRGVPSANRFLSLSALRQVAAGR